MEKNALLLVKNGAKNEFQKVQSMTQKWFKKGGSGYGLTMVRNWVKMCFGHLFKKISKIVQNKLASSKMRKLKGLKAYKLTNLQADKDDKMTR